VSAAAGTAAAEAVDPEIGGPSEDGRDLAYWEGLRRGELHCQRCSGCGTWLSVNRAMCPTCRSFDIDWERVTGSGIVFSWCRSHYPYQPEIADLLPYTSVLVELPDAGSLRLLGLLDGNATEIRIGDRVEARIVQFAGAHWPVLRWAPVTERAAVTGNRQEEA
jgi:uncharacterized OB-fold protein